MEKEAGRRDSAKEALAQLSEVNAAPVQPRAMPSAWAGEVVDLYAEIGDRKISMSAIVDMVKKNGKLFVHGRLDSALPVGAIATIKGAKFLVRRSNSRGQIGLKLMTTAEIAAADALEKSPSTVDLPPNGEELPTVVLSNPSRFMSDGPRPDGESKAIRAEQRERRLTELALDRQRNRVEAEHEAEASHVDGAPSGKTSSREIGAALAAQRKSKKKLAPMLAAQERARQRLENEKAQRARGKQHHAALVAGGSDGR